MCTCDRMPLLKEPAIAIILSVTYRLNSDNNILHLMPYENIRKARDDGNICCGDFVD